MKSVEKIMRAAGSHWVGDGFPVRTLFSYESGAVSPFLLFDYAGPWTFTPNAAPRGAATHPHRGFETVSIVYDGEISHRDSTGAGGVIGPGDVQWMTAGRGVLHQEYHSEAFSRTGGPLRMVQLWVNLPARDKMSPAAYQSIASADIPQVTLADGAARARVIAGTLDGVQGPARSFTPINIWDLRLDGGTTVNLELPEGHTALLAVLSGRVQVNGAQAAAEAEVVGLSRAGTSVRLHADDASIMLVLTGEPILEPVVGYGPFVMNTREEIAQAIADFNSGRLA